MIMKIYDKDGFSDTFISKVIEGIILKTDNLIKESENENMITYAIYKSNIKKFIAELQRETTMQREKSMFKKSNTHTLKELNIITGILKVISDDNIIEDNEIVIWFDINKYEELLEI